MISSPPPDGASSRTRAIGRALVGALLASTGTFVLVRWVARGLYGGSVPWLADRFMRSRDAYSFTVYWSNLLRVPTVVLAVTVGTAALVLLAWKSRPVLTDTNLQAIQYTLRGRLLPLSVLWWVSVVAVARASGLMAFATNDDGMMMLAASGAYGSDPSPVTGFIHVLLGRALVALYTSSITLPWYGLMMLGGQVIGLVVITWLLAESFVRTPGTVPAVALLAVLMVGSYLTLAVQFTQVAITLSAAGFAILLQPKDRRLSLFESVAASLMLLLATMIRADSVVLTTLMVAGIIAPLLLVGRAAPRRVGAVLALVVVVGAFVLDAADDGRFEPASSVDWRSDLHPPGVDITWQISDLLEARLEARYSDLSENDRAMAQRWLFPSSDIFGPATAGGSTTSLPDPAKLSSARAFDVANVRNRVIDTIAFSALLLLVGGASTRSLRERLAGSAAALVPIAGIVLLAGFARAPDRVTVATLLMGAALVSLIRTTSPRKPSPEEGLDLRLASVPPVSVVARITVSAAVLSALAGTGLALTDVHRANVTAARAYQSEARTLIESTQRPDVVLVWLSPFFDGIDPLVTPRSFTELSIVDIAGWHSVMPFHRDRLADLEMTDWVNSLQTSDRVVLLSDSETTALIGTFLSERRGLRCPQPVILGSGELMQVVERFESGDCD